MLPDSVRLLFVLIALYGIYWEVCNIRYLLACRRERERQP